MQEVFDHDKPKRIIIGVHGNGVPRWDGEKFYYQVAEHFTDSTVVLVDQNQFDADGNAQLNPYDTSVNRVQLSIQDIKEKHPNLPIWIVAHSMGCGISAGLNVSDIEGMIFVAPAAGGKQIDKLTERYGEDITEGKTILTSDGLTKIYPKEYIDSIAEMVWKDAYLQLIKKIKTVHVFESGDDDIINESDRAELRDIPFASYTIIDGATHNISGAFSAELFDHMEKIFD